jgi:hypothetical protein
MPALDQLFIQATGSAGGRLAEQRRSQASSTGEVGGF